jgi:hypothetical protein
MGEGVDTMTIYGNLEIGDRFLYRGKAYKKTLLVDFGLCSYNATTPEIDGRSFVVLLKDETRVSIPWQCWTETPEGETVLFEGTEAQARAYYRKHQRGNPLELHIGYDLGFRQNPDTGEWEDTSAA